MSTAPDSNPSSAKPDGPPAPARRTSSDLSPGLRTVSLATFASRLLGLVRDVGMAAVFGNGPVMDAFSVAFRFPNLARGLFGEGALSAAFLPAFLRERAEHGEQAGWRLASGVVAGLSIGLIAVVALGEIIALALFFQSDPSGEGRLLLGLTAVLLPYLIAICVVAQLNAVMYGLNQFLWPSLEPIVLNVAWIGCLWFVVPRFASPPARIYAVAVVIVLSGFLQLAALQPTLRRLGFRFVSDWRGSSARLAEVARATFAVSVGLSVTQLNSLLDGFMAWGFARSATGPETIAWLPGGPAYPLEPGTASALYFGQRVYQFPLGVFGVALGTVLFPLLARHVAEHRMDALRRDLTLGLKLVLFISVPASAGLVLLARPITMLLFQHGRFDAHDVGRTATMIAMYGSGVWAYCGLLIVHRGFYAVGDRRTPLTMSFAGMVANLGLNLILMWPMGGAGLALATATSSAMQFGMTIWLFQLRLGRLDWPSLRRSFGRTFAIAVPMSIVCAIVAMWVPPGPSLQQRALGAAAPILAGLFVYFGLARLLNMEELAALFRRGR